MTSLRMVQRPNVSRTECHSQSFVFVAQNPNDNPKKPSVYSQARRDTERKKRRRAIDALKSTKPLPVKHFVANQIASINKGDFAESSMLETAPDLVPAYCSSFVWSPEHHSEVATDCGSYIAGNDGTTSEHKHTHEDPPISMTLLMQRQALDCGPEAFESELYPVPQTSLDPAAVVPQTYACMSPISSNDYDMGDVAFPASHLGCVGEVPDSMPNRPAVVIDDFNWEVDFWYPISDDHDWIIDPKQRTDALDGWRVS